MPDAPDRQKRSYTRRTPTGKRLTLNEFQADVVLGSLKAEIVRVERETNTPRSLKILALEQLRAVVAMLEPTAEEAE